MISNHDLKFLKIERLRDKYAKSGNIKLFLRTYTTRIAIDNKNTGEMWDYLNPLSQINRHAYPMAWKRTSIVGNWVNKINPQCVLNLGCGPGNIEAVVNSGKIGSSWEGLDLSVESVKNLQKKYPQWRFAVGDITKKQLQNNKYDLVLMLEVLEHINPEFTLIVLKKIYESLKHGGWFICSVPLNEGLEELIKNNNNLNGHVREYTPSILFSELKYAGFKVTQSTKLYAFHSHHNIKSFIAMVMGWPPNNLIVLCQKP